VTPLLVPTHDRIVAETEVAAIEPDAFLATEPATSIFHRLFPSGVEVTVSPLRNR
jgi:hypothetical protein